MSDHSVRVVRVKLEKHPNADSLSIVRVGGFTVCVKTSDWADGDLGAYIPPDSVVDSTRPEFAFLAGHERIRVKRLRGVISMGLLVRVPSAFEEGQDVADWLGVTHYEPPMPAEAGGEAAPAPPGYRPVYDVENLRKFSTLLVAGEDVIVTEKLHGASGRWCWADGQFHCGSRTEWKRGIRPTREAPRTGERAEKENLWWRAFRATPGFAALIEGNPELTIYGEVIGPTSELKYGVPTGDVAVRVFDVLEGSTWVNGIEARRRWPGLPWVPTLFFGRFDIDFVLSLAEGKSTLADHVREGVVVKPEIERTCVEVGRVQFKAIGSGYLERA